jgi:precorrin-6Y C5,15-methyltransferase (decarboxylating)
MLSTCWQALPHNGVLVANVVTLEGQAAILRAHAAYGGQVTQIAVSHSVSVGEFTGLKPAMPVWQWRAVKP